MKQLQLVFQCCDVACSLWRGFDHRRRIRDSARDSMLDARTQRISVHTYNNNNNSASSAMPIRFECPVGAAADLKELEYISALHQTCPKKLREDGSINAADIRVFLRSRFGILVDEKEVKNVVISGLGGGESEEEIIDLMEVVCIPLIPTILKAGRVESDPDSPFSGELPDGVLPPESDLIRKVSKMVLEDVTGGTTPKKLNEGLISKIFGAFGEMDLARDRKLHEEMLRTHATKTRSTMKSTSTITVWKELWLVIATIIVYLCSSIEVVMAFSTAAIGNAVSPKRSSTMNNCILSLLSSSSSASSSSPPPSCNWSVTTRLDRTAAQSLMEELLPSSQYSDRIGLGRHAQGIDDGRNQAMTADDPRLTMTYAEFPLQSLDVLLDAAVQYLPNERLHSSSVDMVDIGSGLGRIVLYAALSRGVQQSPWHVHGIELSPVLHEQALLLAQEGVKRGVFLSSMQPTTSTTGIQSNGGENSFSLLKGRPEDYRDSMIGKADVVFAYSTAFNAKQFDPEVGALILDTEWSNMLGNECQNGCVAITTDRALDPRCGWKLRKQIDVVNPELFGSTGYIHVLEK